MSWIDALKKQVLDSVLSGAGLGGGAPADDASATPVDHSGLLDQIVAMVKQKGLGAMMEVFDKQGLSELFASWVSKGQNLPVSVDQLQKVFGSDALSGLAKQFGLSNEQVSALFSQMLPQVVDKMTPNGQIEEPAAESGHF